MPNYSYILLPAKARRSDPGRQDFCDFDRWQIPIAKQYQKVITLSLGSRICAQGQIPSFF